MLLGVWVGGVADIGKRCSASPTREDDRHVQPGIDARAEPARSPFVARYVSVTSSSGSASTFGLSAERTLILPGDVRYELDLARLSSTIGPGTRTCAGTRQPNLASRLPEIEIAGPEVDLAAAREYGEGGVLSALTRRRQARTRPGQPRRGGRRPAQAGAAGVPMRLAREAARQAIERSFAMPLKAAGLRRCQGRRALRRRGGGDDPSYHRPLAPYNEVIEEARSADGRAGTADDRPTAES